MTRLFSILAALAVLGAGCAAPPEHTPGEPPAGSACEIIKYAMIDGPPLEHWQIDGATYMREHCGQPSFADHAMRRFCAAWQAAGEEPRYDCPGYLRAD